VLGGREGFLITSGLPEDARKDYDFSTTTVWSLAESEGGNIIHPGDLLALSLIVKGFLEKSPKPVVMLHGIDYLTRYNGFTPILRLIQGLSEANATKRGILLLHLVPNSLEAKEEALLMAETTPIPSPVPSKK